MSSQYISLAMHKPIRSLLEMILPISSSATHFRILPPLTNIGSSSVNALIGRSESSPSNSISQFFTQFMVFCEPRKLTNFSLINQVRLPFCSVFHLLRSSLFQVSLCLSSRFPRLRISALKFSSAYFFNSYSQIFSHSASVNPFLLYRLSWTLTRLKPEFKFAPCYLAFENHLFLQLY